MRLEQENDDLAHELVTSKIGLRNELDYVSFLSSRAPTGDWKPWKCLNSTEDIQGLERVWKTGYLANGVWKSLYFDKGST